MIHTELDVYKVAMDFAVNIYKLTRTFPEEEKFVLVSQLRRSAVSIPSNIAEGAGRNSDKEFIQFLYIALGSVAEAETQLTVASRIGYVDSSDPLFKNIADIRKPILGLIKHLKGKSRAK